MYVHDLGLHFCVSSHQEIAKTPSNEIIECMEGGRGGGRAQCDDPSASDQTDFGSLLGVVVGGKGKRSVTGLSSGKGHSVFMRITERRKGPQTGQSGKGPLFGYRCFWSVS